MIVNEMTPMKTTSLRTPILFLIFNRPDTTRQVLERIRQLKPRTLYVAADGPRPYKQGEAQKCEETRALVKNIDWKCHVYTHFSETNLGCRVAVSSAIDWFFSRVDEGIILEDDCVPDLSFFPFCEELLSRYREDARIMHICGVNHQDGMIRGEASYYFSKMNHVWGWATWRRAWQQYDVTIESFPQLLQRNALASIFPDGAMRRYWIKRFHLVHTNQRDTWDYQWQYAMSVNNGLAIIPNHNLVSNIGFGAGATHTIDSFDTLHERPTSAIGRLVHPEFIVPDLEADRYSFHKYTNPNKFRKLWNLVRRIATSGRISS